jgi:small subunit ribosomal protein S1
LHISELADHKVDSPEEVVKVGDEVEVKVLRVDTADRKIGLSRKRLGQPPEEEGDEGAGAPTAPTGPSAPREKRELRGGTGSGSGQLFQMPERGGEEKK